MDHRQKPIGKTTDAARPPAPIAMAHIFFKGVTLILIAAITAPLWPLYWLGCLIWSRPPNVPRLPQVIRYLGLTWSVHPPPPGLSFLKRCWLTLAIVQKVLLTPVWGLVWLIDELLYGRALDETPVVSPVIEVAAGRSGSTQLALYLAQDPRLAAPNILQCMFPYLWLWRLAPRTIGRLLTTDKVRERMRAMMPPALLERHEGDPFKVDTFDGAFLSFHLNHLALHLGPETAVKEFHFARYVPHNKQLWKEDFVALLDRIARKTLLYAGPGLDGSPRRFLVKGHFFAGVNALARHYPDATFVTVIREPVSRLRSAINYMRVNPSHPMLGPVPWAWLAQTLARTESEYGDLEQQWFTRESDTRRCVIRFSEFVVDLETAMKRVYRACFRENELPPYVPTHHAPRERTNYTVNRSLAELGIDEDVLRAQLASYIAWCQGD